MTNNKNFEETIDRINKEQDKITRETLIRILVLDLCETVSNDYDIYKNVYEKINDIFDKLYMKDCLKQTRFAKYNRWIKFC